LRDAGLTRAIDAAGDVAQLARKVGIAQPSVSNRNRGPAERVIAVETATGTSRAALQSDLDAEGAMPDETIDPVTIDPVTVDPVDAARGREYRLLAALLSSAPPQALLDQIARLPDDATPLGRAHAGLAEAASRAFASDLVREYFDLFVGLGRGELLPYASFYLTGFLNERPLSRLRDDLTALGIERVESNFEPEDHAATLCEIMAGLAEGRFDASADAQRTFFERHMSPWMGRLFSDMETAESARFYRAVGALGRLFIEIEAEAFTIAN
jgi:TorA maturation chaperone TorD/DNA-binding transcriptional regulator YdaS (Cro superfamily)